MCGITGILGQAEPGALAAMSECLTHRGPDGSGDFFDDGVALGHRRLAILDIERGHQPMTDPTGSCTIVYNGECYNHLALRQELEAEGVRFATGTDTETILLGYMHWGPEVLRRMEGMFALAIWDTRKKALFVARDPWGIKPFFHASTRQGDWLFASEQKSILAHPDFGAEADEDRLKERAALEFLTGQATVFRGIHQLPPGTWALVRRGDACVSWNLHYQVPAEGFTSIEEAARAIKDRFVASVREQLMSDVPLGVVLSGGLDSAAVAAVHAAAVDRPIHTFTVAGSEDVPDLHAARRVADGIGSIHHETFFDADDMWKGIPRWTWHNENINYTEFFFQPLFALMRGHVKVGLCGQGSDELWGGYPRYRDPEAVAQVRLARLCASRPRHLEDLGAQIAMNHASGSALAEWDQQGQLANFQLRLVDRTSMAHGLEVRVPFLSRPQHAASRAVPWAWKMRDGVEKWILRKAFHDLGLPKDLLWRPKVPAGRATGPDVVGAFEKEAARLVDPARMRKDPMAPAFSSPAEYLVYRLWHAIHIEGNAPGYGGRLPTLEQVAEAA